MTKRSGDRDVFMNAKIIKTSDEISYRVFILNFLNFNSDFFQIGFFQAPFPITILRPKEIFF